MAERSTSYAVFTNDKIRLTDQLTFQLGLRLTSDTVKLDASTFLAAPPMGANATVVPVIPLDSLKTTKTYKNLSYKVGLNFQHDPRNLFYASVSSGYRAGGYSVPFGGVITAFKPESLVDYELGSKSVLLDRRLRLETSIFRYDYKDLQVNVDDPSSPLVPITRNIGRAVAKGAEANIVWTPVEHLSINGGAGYLDAKYTNTTRTITTYGGVIPLQGKPIVDSPRWSLNGQIRYEHPLNDKWSATALVNARWTDARSLRPTDQSYDRVEAYTLLDFRLALKSSDGRWTASIWGKNVLDQHYLTYINNVSFFKIGIYGEPAVYGAEVSYKY